MKNNFALILLYETKKKKPEMTPPSPDTHFMIFYYLSTSGKKVYNKIYPRKYVYRTQSSIWMRHYLIPS